MLLEKQFVNSSCIFLCFGMNEYALVSCKVSLAVWTLFFCRVCSEVCNRRGTAGTRTCGVLQRVIDERLFGGWGTGHGTITCLSPSAFSNCTSSCVNSLAGYCLHTAPTNRSIAIQLSCILGRRAHGDSGCANFVSVVSAWKEYTCRLQATAVNSSAWVLPDLQVFSSLGRQLPGYSGWIKLFLRFSDGSDWYVTNGSNF